MNWRISMAVGIGLLAALPARGDERPPAITALSSLNDEMMDCFSFYGISAEGLRRRNPKDEQIGRTETMLQTLLDLMATIQRQLGLSAMDSNAQILARTKRQLEEIGDTFDYAVLFEKYGKPCRALVEDPAARLRYWADRGTKVAGSTREGQPAEARPATVASTADAHADSRSIVLSASGSAAPAPSAQKPAPLALPAAGDGSDLDRKVVIHQPAVAQPVAAGPAARPATQALPVAAPAAKSGAAIMAADANPPAVAAPPRPSRPEAEPTQPAKSAAGSAQEVKSTAPPVEPPKPAPTAAAAELPKAAPASQAQAASQAPSDSRAGLDPGQASMMLRRADSLVAIGDFSGARLFYERLANAGYKQAAMALARSFDPVWLRQKGAVGVQPDAARAAYWYERAATLAEVPQARP